MTVQLNGLSGALEVHGHWVQIQHKWMLMESFGRIDFFTIPAQYKNANITNFILAVPLEINQTNEVINLEM